MHLSPFQACLLGFLSEMLLPHTIQTGNVASMGLGKPHPNGSTLYDLEESQGMQICRGFLAFSGQKAIPKRCLELPPWLSMLHVLAEALGPSPRHLQVVAITSGRVH